MTVKQDVYTYICIMTHDIALQEIKELTILSKRMAA